MKAWLLALSGLAGLAACGSETPAIPWLYGLSDPVASDVGSDEVARRIDFSGEFSDVDPECSTGAFPGIAITADVSPNPGRETIMASLAHGIVVVDSERRLIAETPGYACDGGSVDELEAVAAGSAYGAPTIAIAATGGGHRENSTWVSLFRVHDHELDAVFTGTVEIRRGDDVERGAIILLPGALVYKHPEGKPALWFYNPVVRSYMLPTAPLEDPHPEPPTVSVR